MGSGTGLTIILVACVVWIAYLATRRVDEWEKDEEDATE